MHMNALLVDLERVYKCMLTFLFVLWSLAGLYIISNHNECTKVQNPRHRSKTPALCMVPTPNLITMYTPNEIF